MSDNSYTKEMEERANKRVTIDTTPREMFNFILKLSSDDEFRSRLEKNPREVLAEHHIGCPPDDIPIDVRLPPKEPLQESLVHIMTGRQTTLRTVALDSAFELIAYLPILAFLDFRTAPRK